MNIHIDNNTVTVTGCQIQRNTKREALLEAKKLVSKVWLSIYAEMHKDVSKEQSTDGGYCQNQSGMACPKLSVPVTSYDVTL